MKSIILMILLSCTLCFGQRHNQKYTSAKIFMYNFECLLISSDKIIDTLILNKNGYLLDKKATDNIYHIFYDGIGGKYEKYNTFLKDSPTTPQLKYVIHFYDSGSNIINSIVFDLWYAFTINTNLKKKIDVIEFHQYQKSDLITFLNKINYPHFYNRTGYKEFKVKYDSLNK